LTPCPHSLTLKCSLYDLESSHEQTLTLCPVCQTHEKAAAPAKLEDLLKFNASGKPFEGQSPLSDVTRPTLAGLNWLAVPSNCVGVAYRINKNVLEALTVTEKGVETTLSTNLYAGLPGVNIAASPDGRLVAVCTIDGSLSCYDVTDTSLGLRWVIEGAHSHVVKDISQSPSTSREKAAGEAGPIRSLQFAPEGYALLLADNGQEGLTIYHAELVSNPKDIVREKLSHIEVASATWSPVTLEDKMILSLAVGASDGAIHMFQYNLGTSELKPITQLPCPGDPDGVEGWSCTHLDWFAKGTALAAGFCRVNPAEEGDEEKEPEECTATHEASLFVIGMDPKTSSAEFGTGLGDGVPFFSVPKNGRHVFFTSYIETKQKDPLLLVASNVASDVGVVSKEADNWVIQRLPGGRNLVMPAIGDDVMFPTGLAVAQVSTDAGTNHPMLLVALTDGSLASFNFEHEKDKTMFTEAGSPATVLQTDPVQEVNDESKE
jgi:WD40 repeat protein